MPDTGPTTRRRARAGSRRTSQRRLTCRPRSGLSRRRYRSVRDRTADAVRLRRADHHREGLRDRQKQSRLVRGDYQYFMHLTSPEPSANFTNVTLPNPDIVTLPRRLKDESKRSARSTTPDARTGSLSPGKNLVGYGPLAFHARTGRASGVHEFDRATAPPPRSFDSQQMHRDRAFARPCGTYGRLLRYGSRRLDADDVTVRALSIVTTSPDRDAWLLAHEQPKRADRPVRHLGGTGSDRLPPVSKSLSASASGLRPDPQDLCRLGRPSGAGGSRRSAADAGGDSRRRG